MLHQTNCNVISYYSRLQISVREYNFCCNKRPAGELENILSFACGRAVGASQKQCLLWIWYRICPYRLEILRWMRRSSPLFSRYNQNARKSDNCKQFGQIGGFFWIMRIGIFLRKIHSLNYRMNSIELSTLFLMYIISTTNTVSATWSLLVHRETTGFFSSLTGFLMKQKCTGGNSSANDYNYRTIIRNLNSTFVGHLCKINTYNHICLYFTLYLLPT